MRMATFSAWSSQGARTSLGAIVEFPAGGGARTIAGELHPRRRRLQTGRAAARRRQRQSVWNDAVGRPRADGVRTQEDRRSYSSTPTVLASFGSGIVPSGSGNLVEDAAGDLFGTTTNSVFEVQKTGASYAPPVSLVPFPVGTQIGTLTIDAKGDIFGTTISGGANDDGSVFEIEKTATGYAGTRPPWQASPSQTDNCL